MKKGDRSQFKLYGKQNGCSDVRLQPECAFVKLVIIYGRPDSTFGGVELFDATGAKILTAGNIGQEKREIILQEGERLIGIKFKTKDGTTYGKDLQFVIGRLD